MKNCLVMPLQLLCTVLVSGALAVPGIAQQHAASETTPIETSQTETIQLEIQVDEPLEQAYRDEQDQLQYTTRGFWLGVGLKRVEGDLASFLGSPKGVFVVEVVADSPADEAGVKAGGYPGHVSMAKHLTEPADLVNKLQALTQSGRGDGL